MQIGATHSAVRRATSNPGSTPGMRGLDAPQLHDPSFGRMLIRAAMPGMSIEK